MSVWQVGLKSIWMEEGVVGLERLLAGPFEQLALVKMNRNARQAPHNVAERQMPPLGEQERVMDYLERIPAGIRILEGELL